LGEKAQIGTPQCEGALGGHPDRWTGRRVGAQAR